MKNVHNKKHMCRLLSAKMQQKNSNRAEQPEH